jgi:FecR protein
MLTYRPNSIVRWFGRAASLWGLTLLLMATSVGLAEKAAAQGPAGSLIDLQGGVMVERGGHATPAAKAMMIMLGDKIETSNDSSVTILLADGSQLTLAESSAMVIDSSMIGPGRSDSMIELFQGKLHSVINPRNGSLPEFEVHTPNAVAGVRGTDFETEYIAGKPCPGFPQCLRYTDVGVYKGVVEVRNPTSTSAVTVRVSGGYETTVPCELPPASPGPLGMGDLTAPGYH